jgi:hypothetical protein
MLRLIPLLLAIAVAPAMADEPVRFTISEVLDVEGQRMPVTVQVRLDAVSESRIAVRADADLGGVQAVLPGLLRDVLDPDCGTRIAYQLDGLRAEGDHVRGAGTVQVTLYACNGYDDISKRVKLLSNTSTIDALIGGGIENGCVTGQLRELTIKPSGIIGGVLNITGLTTQISEGVRTDINALLTEGDNCLDLPRALRIMNTRITRGGFRDDRRWVGLGFFIEGSVDVTAPNLLALLRHLDEEGLLDR